MTLIIKSAWAASQGSSQCSWWQWHANDAIVYHNPKGSCAVYRQEKWFMIINYVVFWHVCIHITRADLQDELWSLLSPLLIKNYLAGKFTICKRKILPKTILLKRLVYLSKVVGIILASPMNSWCLKKYNFSKKNVSEILLTFLWLTTLQVSS